MAFLLCCCGQRPEVTKQLLRVEQLMNQHPDSALLLLRQIKEPEMLNGKQRADYALLLTQAQDKNYLDDLQSDSLISYATQYYSKQKDNARAGKAFFYHGKVMALQGNDSLAIHYYLEAEDALKSSNEYKMYALVHEFIGKQSINQNQFKEGISHLIQATSLNLKIGDSISTAYCYNHLANCYHLVGAKDSTLHYINKALMFLKNNDDTPIYSSLMQMLSEIELKDGNFKQAISYIQDAIEKSKLKNSTYHYIMSLGLIYLKMGEYTLANDCFKKVLQSTKVWTLSGAYYYLYVTAKREKNLEAALFYKEKSDSLLNIHRNGNLEADILRIKKEFQNSKLEAENKILIYRNYSYTYLVGCLFLLITFTCIWFKKRLKKQYDYTQEIIKNNERTIGQYFIQIQELKDRETRTSIEKDLVKEKLEHEITLLIEENRALQQEYRNSGMEILNAIRNHKICVHNLTNKEKEAIFSMMDFMYNGYVSCLKEKYALTNKTLLLPILIKMGFSTEELSYAFDCELEAIWKRKQRLKEKLGLNKNENLENFLIFKLRNVHKTAFRQT